MSFSDEEDEYVFERMALLLMVIEVILEQPAKVFAPIVLTLFGMVTEFKLEQPSKA